MLTVVSWAYNRVSSNSGSQIVGSKCFIHCPYLDDVTHETQRQFNKAKATTDKSSELSDDLAKHSI